MSDREVLEGVALDVHGRTGFDDSVDTFDLIADPWMRMSVKWTSEPVAYRVGRRLCIPRSATAYAPRLHGLVTHEAAHVLLDDYAVKQSESAAQYLGAALLVPRRALDRDLRGGWDLRRLLARHPNASAELLARRIVDVRRASLALYDDGRFRYRVGDRDASPQNERELVAEALETRAPIRVDDLTGAWPVFSQSRSRVLVLAAA